MRGGAAGILLEQNDLHLILDTGAVSRMNELIWLIQFLFYVYTRMMGVFNTF